jgi:hypothetical protein
MQIPLGAFLSAVAAPIVRQVLVSLGFGIITYSGVLVTLNALLAQLRTDYASATGYTVALLGLSGIGYALGTISAALVFRVSMSILPKLAMMTK